MPSLKRKEWPEELASRYGVAGLFVGGCVARGDGSSFRAKAHAHVDDAWHGWICVRKRTRISDRMLMLHELAHLVAGTPGHTDAWRRTLLRLGGTLEPTESLQSYQKRPANNA